MLCVITDFYVVTNDTSHELGSGVQAPGTLAIPLLWRGAPWGGVVLALAPRVGFDSQPT